MRKQMKKREGILRILLRKLVKFSKRKLFWNKVFAILMTLVGLLSVKLLEGDWTGFMMSMFVALPLYLARINIVTIELNYDYIERIL
mgnify:CR=1 FL=1